MHLAEKGRDPRRYSMIAFGGAGPVHAYNLAKLLKLKRVIVPLGAGVTSALGFLVAAPAIDYVRSYVSRLEQIDCVITSYSIHYTKLYEGEASTKTCGSFSQKLRSVFRICGSGKAKTETSLLTVPEQPFASITK